MNHENRNTMFYLLDQKGIFRTAYQPPNMELFPGRQGRMWVKKLQKERLETRYRTIRNQIFEFLDVASFQEIKRLLGDESKKSEVRRRAFGLIGNMFGCNGTEREVVSRVEAYSSTADGVIRYLKSKILANYAPYIEMTNEIDMISNPVDLLLIVFDDRYHKKARFEAKRKLILMNLAGSIDQRERETDIENKFKEFLAFLNAQVWSPGIKIGELKSVYLVSKHNPEDFSCRDVKVVPQQQIRGIKRQAGQKITLIKRRQFTLNGREDPDLCINQKKTARGQGVETASQRGGEPGGGG